MIFVTVGNATQGFWRLLDAVDVLAGKGVFGQDEVVIQSGTTSDFQGLHCRQVSVFPMEQFSEMIAKANLVICHAGAGTLLHVLQARKVPVVMPRRKHYGELVDDHQMELTRALATEGRIVPAYEPEDLPTAVVEARRCNAQQIRTPTLRMPNLVAQAIDELLGRDVKK